MIFAFQFNNENERVSRERECSVQASSLRIYYGGPRRNEGRSVWGVGGGCGTPDFQCRG